MISGQQLKAAHDRKQIEIFAGPLRDFRSRNGQVESLMCA
jgi:hypothetical protein